MEKHGGGDDDELPQHLAIRVPLTAPALGDDSSPSSSDPDLASDDPDSIPLLQRASKLVSTSVTAYLNKPASFWALLALSAGAMLTAFPASSLLSRVYYDAGGQSKWILSWSAVAGWPIPALLLLPSYLFLDGASPTWPPPLRLWLWYVLLGLLSAADNLMYAWAYAYLPASTASLVAASSLAFSAVFGRIIVKKNNGMGLATVNAIVVITAGVVVVALDSGSGLFSTCSGPRSTASSSRSRSSPSPRTSPPPPPSIITATTAPRLRRRPVSSMWCWSSRWRCRWPRSRSRRSGWPSSVRGSGRWGARRRGSAEGWVSGSRPRVPQS